VPELPEVETIRRELQTRLSGEAIHTCHIARDDVIAYPPPLIFPQAVINEKILSVKRRAKYLIIELSHHKKLIVHLRLSGTLRVRPAAGAIERFTRVSFLTDKYLVLFNEPRALGRIWLLTDQDNDKTPQGLLTLGLEPTSSEFDLSYFRKKIKTRKAHIKSLLLDQRICAGVGNIYSDEALFYAGIRPLRRACRITIEETSRLLTSLKTVLNKAIEHCGTSVGDYTRTAGNKGNFQRFLQVYGREGQPCRRCGNPIKVTKLGNRSTRYCPYCQK
jgi:formamidopyrimidine-DNA glycosylase